MRHVHSNYTDNILIAFASQMYLLLSRLHEVLSWVLEVPPDAPAGEARVTWTVKYVMDLNEKEEYPDENSRKITAKLIILKDDIQAVLPIAKVSSSCWHSSRAEI